MALCKPVASVVACVLCCVAFAEETPVIGVRAAAFLIVDYLPPAIYDGDNLSACFRVENASPNDGAFEVSAKTLDATGAELKLQTVKVAIAHGGFGPVKFEADLKRVSSIRFELKKAGDTAVLASEAVSLVREGDPWPKTKIVNGRMTLTSSGGGIVVPVVQKKRAVEERAFAPMKWIFGTSKDDGGRGEGGTRVFAPGAWDLAGTHEGAPGTQSIGTATPAQAVKKKSDEAGGNGIRALGPWPLDGSIPILNAVGQILGELGSAGEVKRVVILLPPEDLDLATEPRVYRVALDALLARLAKAGIGRIVLIAPFRYGCNEAHRKALWREVHESAAVNSVRAIDPNDWMSEIQWRVDPATPKVYAPRPNASGRKIIEQALSDLIH